MERILIKKKVQKKNGRSFIKISSTKNYEDGFEIMVRFNNEKHQNEDKKWCSPKNIDLGIKNTILIWKIDKEFRIKFIKETKLVEKVRRRT